MRRFLTLLAISGCASGTSSAPLDGQGGQQDAASLLDAPGQIDAAPPIDGPLIDATPPIDAMVDATVTTPDACVPTVTELLVNKDFDGATTTPWTEIRYDSTVALIGPFTGFNPQAGTKYAWLGGWEAFPDDDAADYVYQNITVPPMTTQLVVSGYMAIGTSDSFPQADVGLVGFLFPNAPATAPIIIVNKTNSDAASFSSWTPFAQTIVTPLSGQVLRFQMEVHDDVFDPTSFLFDSLSVRATHGCP